jgi:hypothetical protein
MTHVVREADRPGSSEFIIYIWEMWYTLLLNIIDHKLVSLKDSNILNGELYPL